ncbi:DASH family cryptochrome [Natronogracilivirga saccharolytica]|uniref:Cryptochrome DASH n=1 Tax=Natronogracilivirga saccharolytica TaxID=2812953 RepID=A0A8J7SCH9_9BACT|nr:DASH family cryptochrome [Natronogracilivirga saccharolytica]MBP3193511.1 DASH family cryptochrome [Natronogracilivirga saccharolytica]
MTITLHLFRNDLRLLDNPALTHAAQNGSHLIPLYVLDERVTGKTRFGFPKTGPHRQRFLRESLSQLDKSLQANGSGLLVATGRPHEIIASLCDAMDISLVTFQEEIAPEEKETERAIREVLSARGISLRTFRSFTLFHPDDLPMPVSGTPDVFTQFRKRVEKYSEIRPALPAPEFPPLPPLPESLEHAPGTIGTGKASLDHALPQTYTEPDPRAAIVFRGGEDQALARLDHYFWKTDELQKYKFKRNGLLGPDYSSKFSAWLANGCLSPRTIHDQVKLYESERKKNVSTYWLIFELIWRDYFHFIMEKYGARLFHRDGLSSEPGSWSTDPERFQKWRDGETGIPFIDANMRELAATGYMSNRGRQNVASYLSKYLGIDWRMGAEWFESMLIDYDVHSNWGNWAYVSGVGNDPRDRYFHILNQARKYDPKGDYVRHWLPELAGLPEEHIHEPWKTVHPPAAYPGQLIDFEQTVKRLSGP